MSKGVCAYNEDRTGRCGGMVDANDSKSFAARRVSSNLTTGI